MSLFKRLSVTMMFLVALFLDGVVFLMWFGVGGFFVWVLSVVFFVVVL